MTHDMTGVGPEEIFAIDPHIRWAGFASNKGQVVFAQMRPAVKRLTPEADDKLLVELRALYITEMCGLVNRCSGPTDGVAVTPKKFTELIVMLENDYAVVTLEQSVSP